MNAFGAADHAHMARALRLAERGLYTTQPNPRVGCVLAHGDEIVGEGWHERAGDAHAEVFALRAAAERAAGATAYVTLEPCAHFGRTPPCADALIGARVARVVAACEDPNPKVAGGGFAKLRDAGVAVETGLMRDAARELNRGFLSRLERGRPWVRVKLAMSLDGRTALADGTSTWITGDAARADVQRWRARSSAILTGVGTVLADDPRLTVRLEFLSEQGGEERSGAYRDASLGVTSVRHPASPSAADAPSTSCGVLPAGEGKSSVAPLRVVLDSALRTPPTAHIVDGSALTLLLHAPDVAPSARVAFAHAELAAVQRGSDPKIDLDATLRLLAERGINELQVEAGPTLCGALFAAGLVDELLLYVAPVMLGDQARPLLTLPRLDDIAQGRRLRVIDQRQVGADWRLLLRE